MQFLGRAMNRALAERGGAAVILGATSGDTGAAAIEAFGGGERTDVFILYPHGRVSEVQRRQMTTVDRPGVHAIAIDGSFDDCQDIVKSLFGDLAFRDEMSLSGVNSINWARILAQIVYYFTSAVALGAPEPRGLLRRADRQFRRRARRLVRQAHGAAGRAADRRHQRERHSRPRAGDRRIPAARRKADAIAVDGHSGLLEFRAAAVRAARTRRRAACAG